MRPKIPLKIYALFRFGERIRKWTKEYKHVAKSDTKRYQKPQKGHLRSRKVHQKGTQLMPKRAKILQDDGRG